MKLTHVLCSAALLSLVVGCGGGGGGGDAGTNQPQGDQFTAAVQSIVATSSEDTEPQSIDATATTAIDDKDATPIS